MAIIRVYCGVFLGFIRGVVFAIGYTLVYYQLIFTWHGPSLSGAYVEVHGTVQQTRVLGATQFVTLRLNDVADYAVPFYQNHLLSVAVHANQPVAMGAKLSADMRVKSKRWRVNYDVLDRRIYGFLHGFSFTGSSAKNITITNAPPSIRQRYLAWLKAQLQPLELKGVYLALLSAERSDIEPKHNQFFKHSGIIHLLAISGLHISLLYGLCFIGIKCGLWCAAHGVRSGQWQQALTNRLVADVALLISGIFVLLCALPISAQRAWLMLAVFVWLYFSRQHYSLSRCLLIALACVLLANPFALLNIGLWFSFLAVAAIVIALVQSQRWHWLSRYMFIQLWLFIALAPLSAATFGGFSWASAPMNLIAVPFVSFILLPLLIVVVLTGFSEPMLWLLRQLDLALSSTLEGAIELGPVLWFSTGELDTTVVIIYYLTVMAILIKPSLWPVCYAGGLFVGYCAQQWVYQPRWQLDVLDVGHGLSIVISRQGKAVVYDLGPSYFSRYSIVKNTLLPIINARGLQVEHTIISHSDNDHAGGLEHWLQAGYGHTLKPFHNGNPGICRMSELSWHGLTVRSIWPHSNQQNDNANSCVVHISDGKYNVLLSGDITEREEQQLLTQDKIRPVDVLVSAHHGSDSSSSAAFIKQAKPKVVIHSSGTRRNWQMPHPEVFARFAAHNAEQYQTKLQGGIRVQFYDTEMQIKTAKADKSYWFISD
ncbi:DNA internalization-related competence protein ComEC/Rec2 [Pseudoalteromonas sp. CnMc7-15]|uniref:DNA internalization-related competence protein ComEC/Rec2 n=1 Tax=unclassified Pseudoalteromonas TaxID=194690 RepID=UPI001EF3DACF|nr:DNA internalization-related competence protein ComEC/Rec2 [Pseudoalteromonas sp. CnMc7-15]MCG7564983.1 DNA internalization-related competence protein ComEC/Rec2 [Pseudoalteromonas sp. CnMc7-15]